MDSDVQSANKYDMMDQNNHCRMIPGNKIIEPKIFLFTTMALAYNNLITQCVIFS